MLFHHKIHKIRSKEVLSNKKLNDTKTCFPLKITYFILRITRTLFAKIAKDLYHGNAYKMLQGKGRSKIEDFK